LIRPAIGQGARSGAAQFADTHSPRQRSFDLFRKRRGLQSAGARFPGRGRLRNLTPNPFPRGKGNNRGEPLGVHAPAPLGSPNRLAGSSGTNRVLHSRSDRRAYRECGQRGSGLRDFLVRPRDEQKASIVLYQAAQPGALLAGAQYQVGREILSRLQPRKHDIFLATQVFGDHWA